VGSNSQPLVLKNRSDFLYILKNGERVRASSWMTMNFVRQPEKRFRVGWTLPRQVGPAVIRNKLKRWARVFVRAQAKSGRSLSVDLNVVFRKAEDGFYKKLEYAEFADVMEKGWKEVEKRSRRPTPTNAS
jgi:ribonuclease P protein component